MKLPSENAERGEREGLRARDALGLTPSQPLDDILRALERTTDVLVFVRALGDDALEGAFWFSQKPFVLVNASKPLVRQRFTLAHEFGHYFLGHGNTYDVSVNWSNRDPKEVQANFFAASFLMPAPAIAAALSRMAATTFDFDTLVTLATQFGVSAKAMRIRLETVEAITAKQVRQFDALIEHQAHYGRHEALGVTPVSDTLAAARRFGSRMPPSMTWRVFDAVDRRLLVDEQAAIILRTELDQLDALRDELLVVSE